MLNSDSSILIIGGAGLTGSRTARLLRQRHPELPLTIGGRDRAKAAALARELGYANATVIDLARPNLGLDAGQRFSAVMPFVKDETLESLRYAQSIQAGYLSISSGVFEMAPEVAQYAHEPTRSAIVLGSHWFAGAATFAVLHLAREFARLDAIAIGAVLDDRDIGGPAAVADYERLTTMSTSALLREDGRWRWVRGADAERVFSDSSGTERRAQTYTPYDVVGLAAATQAPSVRFDIFVGELELQGETRSGGARRVRHELVHAEGQVALTALSVVLVLERLAGVGGAPPVPPGLYFPERVVEPSAAFEQMLRHGLEHRRVGG
jgi:hypothetical protein